MIKSYGLDSNNHSVYKLNYHFIITTKYRRKVITHDIAAHLKDTFTKIQGKYNVELSEFGYEQDHIHILFTAAPNTELSKFINTYKSATSRTTRSKFPQVKKRLRNGTFWSHSYFLTTTGGAPLDIVKQYIQDQGYMNERRDGKRA